MTLGGILASAVALGVGGVVLVGGLVLFGQRAILFPGTTRSAPDVPAFAGLEVTVDWLETSGGRVESWYLAARSGPGSRLEAERGRKAPALLFCHGNGELIDDWLGPMALLRDQGLAINLVEYPGYGRSTGSPSEESIAAVLRSAYDRLIARPEVDGDRVVLYGRSLGGGAVGTLLRSRPVAAVVFQSTFTDVPRLARRLLPVLPRLLIRDSFDTLRAVAAYSGPVLVAHGRHDDLIPFAHGEALAAAAQSGELVPYACSHNDCPPDWREFTSRIARFLERNGVLRGAGAS